MAAMVDYEIRVPVDAMPVVARYILETLCEGATFEIVPNVAGPSRKTDSGDDPRLH